MNQIKQMELKHIKMLLTMTILVTRNTTVVINDVVSMLKRSPMFISIVKIKVN